MHILKKLFSDKYSYVTEDQIDDYLCFVRKHDIIDKVHQDLPMLVMSVAFDEAKSSCPELSYEDFVNYAIVASLCIMPSKPSNRLEELLEDQDVDFIEVALLYVQCAMMQNKVYTRYIDELFNNI